MEGTLPLDAPAELDGGGEYFFSLNTNVVAAERGEV
jgi:hypothetical protein